MVRANEDIRREARQSGILLWEIADNYGLSDTNFSKLLRHPLPEDKRRKIFGIIESLKKREVRAHG